MVECEGTIRQEECFMTCLLELILRNNKTGDYLPKGAALMIDYKYRRKHRAMRETKLAVEVSCERTNEQIHTDQKHSTSE